MISQVSPAIASRGSNGGSGGHCAGDASKAVISTAPDSVVVGAMNAANAIKFRPLDRL